MNETQYMSVTTTSIAVIIVKNLCWLLTLAFYPFMEFMIEFMPDWRGYLEVFKLIGGAVIMLMVIIKLFLEIVKLLKNKQ